MNRAQAKIEARREQVSFLYCTGKTQAQIAAALGISQQVVSYDLRQCRARWQEKTLHQTEEWLAEQLAKLDVMEAELWQAWFDSKKPHEITETEASEGGEVIDIKTRQPRLKAAVRKARLRKEGSCGDPRYVERLQKCWDQRAALLGLNAPLKFSIDWETLSDEQLADLASARDPSRVLRSMAEA